MTETFQLAVIGGGPAGMEAAITAAEAGVTVIIIDNFPSLGGQYYKPLPDEFGARKKTKTEREAEVLFKMVKGLPITQVHGALVWGLFPDEKQGGWLVAVHGEGAPKKVHVQAVVLATGAYDTPVAFPGWTLPGVLTAGAALTLVKTQRVAPGRRALVVGTGPLLLSAAAHLIDAGVQVPAVCEASRPFFKAIPYAFTALGQLGRIEEGIKYASKMASARTPYKMGWSIVEARGTERVEEAVITRLDSAYRPVEGSEQTIAVDTVVTGFHLIPNTGLARMIGCEFEYCQEKGGWVPLRDKTMQSSQPGVYIAGDGAGIGGAEMARLEGRMAGLAAAVQVGGITQGEAGGVYGRLKSELKHQRGYARMLGALFTPRPGLTALAKDDTLICRCEEITLGEIRSAVAAGARTLGEVKMITRTGMGNCQGRMCEHGVTNAIVAALTAEKATHQQVGMYSIRPPLHPLPVDVLADAAEELD
ncbi:MAG: FAD-dependent oxidoreductase [Anaerolineaceae bacterium]|nr:FAD-dependent oxidoreductase [Anaerolineaceae bacterium]